MNSESNDKENVSKLRNIIGIGGLFALGSLFAIISAILYANSKGNDIVDDNSFSELSSISANNEYFIRQENVQNDINGNIIISYVLSDSLTSKCKNGGCYVRSTTAKPDETPKISGGPSVILGEYSENSGEITITKSSLIDALGIEDIEKKEFIVRLYVDIFDDKDSYIGLVEGPDEKYIYESE